MEVVELIVSVNKRNADKVVKFNDFEDFRKQQLKVVIYGVDDDGFKYYKDHYHLDAVDAIPIVDRIELVKWVEVSPAYSCLDFKQYVDGSVSMEQIYEKYCC